MRIALIALGDADATGERRLAGRTLARHQLDFALAQGCEKIILFGHGAAPEAISVRHAAEAGGAQVQVVRGVRDLPAAVRGDDRLLVLAHGLLPDSPRALELLREGDGVLVLPAEEGWSAGFERLDLAAAWGGAMVLPGRLVAALDQLPEDAEPIAGLLRIARQAGLPERPLPQGELAEGRWQIVRSAEAAQAIEPNWMRRRLPTASPFRPTGWLAQILVLRFGSSALSRRYAGSGLAAGAVLLAAVAVVAAWFDAAAASFALLIPTALAIETGDALAHLGQPIFQTGTKRSRLSLALHFIWDMAFLAIGALVIDASRAHRLFAPLVAVGLLHLPPRWPETGWRALAADRAVLAFGMAISAAFGLAEGGFMLLCLALLALRLAVPAHDRS